MDGIYSRASDPMFHGRTRQQFLFLLTEGSQGEDEEEMERKKRT